MTERDVTIQGEMPTRGMNDEAGDLDSSIGHGMVVRSMNDSPGMAQSESPLAIVREMPKPAMVAEAAPVRAATREITTPQTPGATSEGAEMDVELAVYLRGQERAKQGGMLANLGGMPGPRMNE